jgi:hypothetical protein
MVEPIDAWPNFSHFNPGPPKHLHAVAVISSCFNTFERLMFDLYIHHLDRNKYSRELSESYYLAIDEQKRVDALKATFRRFEKRKRVIDLIDNLSSYFKWCAEVRNSVVHGEAYPTIIAPNSDLNFSKATYEEKQNSGLLITRLGNASIFGGEDRTRPLSSSLNQLSS